jgi:hypothetical protein
MSEFAFKKGLQQLIDILALPNMGDEGRKLKLIAVKEWQIVFLQQLRASSKDLESKAKTSLEVWELVKGNGTYWQTKDKWVSIDDVLKWFGEKK